MVGRASSARRSVRREHHGPLAKVHTLTNGLRVVLLEDHSAPVVAMQTWVQFGSADEDPQVAGIAHVFEHMLFKGTQRFPHGEIAALIEGAGGSINAWTSYDETVYHVTLSSRFWETGFDVLSDAVLHSLFDATELAREKEVVLEELRRGKDNPDREISERLFELVFTTHPYHRPVIGFEDTVTKIDRDDMLRVFNTWYVPNNMVFVAVGDFDSTAILDAIEERFGSVPRQELPQRPRTQEPAQTAPRICTVPFHAEMARVEIAFPSVDANDPRVPALDLLSDFVGSGYNSLLYTELKRRQGLAHDIYAYNYTPENRGLFLLGASCDPDNVPAIVRSLMEQAQRALSLRVSAAEMASTKKRIVSQFVHTRETYQGIAEQIGRCTMIYDNPNYGEQYIAAIEALSLDDLHHAAAAILDPQQANIAVLMPEGLELPACDTVQAWAQAGTQKAPNSFVLRTTTDTVAQVSVVELPGNRTLIVQTDRKAPLVSIRTILDGGQRIETPKKAGIARLCTTVWDRGTELMSAAEIERSLDRLGASMRAMNDRDTVQLSARCLKETFTEGLEHYFDVLTHPLFPEAEVAREQADQLRDLHSLKENRFPFAFRHFLSDFYGDHPYKNLSLGQPESLASVTREDLLAFHRSLLQSQRAVFAVVGDISVDEVMELFHRYAPPVLFDITGTAPTSTPELPVRSEPVEQILEMEGQQTHIVWGFPAVTMHDPDRYPLRMLESILGGMGGRLFVELRDKKSLAYTVTTLDAYPVDPGFFALYIGCSPEKEAEAIQEFERVLHEVQQHGVLAEELDRACTYLEGILDIGFQGTSQRTAVYGLGHHHSGKWDAFRTYLNAIRKVTSTDVQRVAQTYLDPARSIRVILRAER